MTIAALAAAGPVLGTYTDATLTRAASTFTGTAQGGTSTPFSIIQPDDPDDILHQTLRSR